MSRFRIYGLINKRGATMEGRYGIRVSLGADVCSTKNMYGFTSDNSAFTCAVTSILFPVLRYA